jgi:hypothetical protein
VACSTTLRGRPSHTAHDDASRRFTSRDGRPDLDGGTTPSTVALLNLVVDKAVSSFYGLLNRKVEEAR